MHWRDEGIVLSARRFSESAAIVNLLTREHGRHAGLLQGGGGSKGRAILQPGNAVSAQWRARLSEQLGNFQLELTSGLTALLFDDVLRLAALDAACALADAALPEREPHPGAFAGMARLRELLAAGRGGWAAEYVRFELDLLAELGFGLDLETCAATGSRENLHFVSPKSGRAVSAAAAEPFRDKLLALPEFLRATDARPAALGDVLAGLALTGWFLDAWVLQPHGAALPAARARLVERLSREATTSSSNLVV